MTDIPITKPFFDDQELKAIKEVLDSGWIVQGPKVAEFEKLFAQKCNVKHAIATTSCTTALHLALRSLDLQANDKIVVPAFTWVTTANVVEYIQGQVLFCDIDLNTFNLDLKALEKILDQHSDIKAIIPVHMFGLATPMESLLQLAKKQNIKIIEDAACGFGSYNNNKHVGSQGDMGCFSFHPRKNITTGEGGLITTNNDDWAQKARRLRDHGASVSDRHRHNQDLPLLPDFNLLGYNYRMTDIQAAMGIVQLKKADQILNTRKKLAHRYTEELKNVTELLYPSQDSSQTHAYQGYVTLVNPKITHDQLTLNHIEKYRAIRNKLMQHLLENGISVRQGTHAVHGLSLYRDRYQTKPKDFIKAWAAEHLSLALPLYVTLSENQQDQIINAVKRFFKRESL